MPTLEERKKMADQLGSGMLGKAARAAVSREQRLKDALNAQFGPREYKDKKNVKTSGGK